MGAPVIAEARADHLDAIHRLNREAVPAVNDVPVSFFRDVLSDASGSDGRYFRVVHERDHPDAVLAFLLALPPGEAYRSPNYRWFSDRYRRFLYVDRVVVAPEGRRRGLGSSLYDDLAAFARALGMPRICCEVNVRPRNESSLHFHQRRGFGSVGSQETDPVEPSVDGAGETAGSAKIVSLLVRDLP